MNLQDTRTLNDKELEGAVRRARKICKLYELIKQGNFIAAGDVSTLLRSRGVNYQDAFAEFVQPNTGLSLPEWDALLRKHDLYQSRLP
tara:strand:+ start:96 stop:359 length:264 start_codon:yes stop_codon:yes gene_type:complete